MWIRIRAVIVEDEPLDPKQVAEDKCTKKSGDDAKKMNECMAAERKNFPADGYRFKKDEKGQWWWITVRQNGNRLVSLHKIPVEFGEETANSITLKPVGKDKGSAPMNPPAMLPLSASAGVAAAPIKADTRRTHTVNRTIVIRGQ